MGPTIMLPGGGTVAVRGESQYQRSLDWICGGRTPSGHDHPCEAVLVAEARNPHDPNAIAVYVDGRQVGYMASGATAAYRPVIDALGGEGASCAATVQGGWDRGPDDQGAYRVTLDLADPDRCLAAIAPAVAAPDATGASRRAGKRSMTWLLPVAIVALAAVGGLIGGLIITGSGDDEPSGPAETDPPTCQELFAAGRPVDEIVDALAEDPACVDGDHYTVVGFVTRPCSNGTTTVYYNDFGWGTGGGRWQTWPAGDPVREPAAGVC
jgi:HIRAN domain-containing protein